MPDADLFHCRSCSRPPRYALTEYGGKLWGAECLSDKTRQEIAHPRPAPPYVEPAPAPAPEHGFTVGDVPREIEW